VNFSGKLLPLLLILIAGSSVELRTALGTEYQAGNKEQEKPLLLSGSQYNYVVIGRGLAQCMLNHKIFPKQEIRQFFQEFIGENAGVSMQDYIQLSRDIGKRFFDDVSKEIDRQGGCQEIIRAVDRINKAIEAPRPVLQPKPSTPFEW
jgi:hypothetical protein